jgi:hypothetical protein
MSYMFVDSFRAGPEELPETCRVSCQNKFMKLVHVVGFIIKKLVKGKPIPLEAWTGPYGSRGLRLPNFKTVGR